MNKAKILLRSSAALLLIHIAGHLFGHGTWKLSEDPEQQSVIGEMTGKKFPFMGALRSFGDYYEGYGWLITIALLFFTLLLFFIAGAGAECRRLSVKILMTLSLSLTAWSMLEFRYFFVFAGAITLLAAILTVAGTLVLLRAERR